MNNLNEWFFLRYWIISIVIVKNKKNNKISLSNLFFENFGDILEIVVGQSDVDDVFLQLRAFVDWVQQVADFGLEIRLANLPLSFFVSQYFVLMFQVVNHLLQVLLDSLCFCSSESTISILALNIFLFLHIQVRFVFQSGFLCSFSCNFEISS
jgi:hypothetical protein